MTPPESAEESAVLLMGYGSPSGAGDLPGYLSEVLGGRSPSPELVKEYERRYALIGGSPQNRILASLRAKLERRLAAEGAASRVYFGTKHWKPNIAEVLPQMARDGVRRVVAIPLSPFASSWILEPYQAAIERGLGASVPPLTVDLRAGWHLNPHLLGYWRDAIARELTAVGDPSSCVLLSAHSLPKRMHDRGDPYPEILAECSSAIARAGDLSRWSFTFQSAGNTTEPWLGPDITEVMREWQGRGARTQIVASFGFIFDHLEVLYDLDIVVRAFASEHGIVYRRVPMPNDGDALVEALADQARPSRFDRA
jgi:ferrochelatase